MPKRVRRVEQRPVIAETAGAEGVEGCAGRGRRDRGPPRGGGVPGRWGLGIPPLREGFGRVGLGRSYHDPRTEAHAIDMDVDKACLAPVALDGGLRVRRVEAL